MRQHPQTIPVVTIALDRDAQLHSDKAPVERAVEVIECLAGRGFEVVPKPLHGSTAEDRVEFARRTGCWDGVSDRDYMDWVQSLVPGSFIINTVEELTADSGKVWSSAAEFLDRDHPVRAVRLEPGRLEPTETEKAASWASVLIAKILEDGTARQAEAGVEAAAKKALLRLRRDRDRVAFEDIDRNPPMGACHASDLFAGWARSLGDKVEWCEARLPPRRLVLTVSLRREASQEERADLDWRLKFLGQMGGVVGTSVNAGVNLGTGAAEVEVEVRFAHYITTLGCEYTPGDLPARPARKVA